MSASVSHAATPQSAREELVATAMALPAVLAVVVGLVDYFSHESGIRGTPGALLVTGGSLVLAITAFAVGRMAPGAWRTTLTAMILVGAALTALAAWFLESVLIVLGMVLLMACWAVFIMVAR